MIDFSERFFAHALDELFDGVYFVDRQRRILFWNKAAERLTGYSSAEAVGKSCFDNLMCHVDHTGRLLCNDACPMQATMERGESQECDVFLRHKDGARRPVRVRATPLKDDAGHIVGCIEVFSDNSEKMAIESEVEELRREALLDVLTALPNRRFLEMMLSTRQHEFERHGWAYGVLFADIDHFKRFNDTYGHETGDRVLKMVARSLAETSRRLDNFGRWGGEEFLGVIAKVDLVALAAIAERCRVLVATSGSRDEHTLQATISIGGALARRGETTEALVARADAQLYRAKQAGRNRVCIAER